MTNMETRMAALEQRLQQLEDQNAIYQLLTSYGPSVDSCSAAKTGALWTEDGVYDSSLAATPFVGRDGVADLVNQESHQGYVKQGCAHVISLPHIVISGDSAVATCYSRVYLREGDHYRVERVSANRWELERTGQGWRVKLRTNRLVMPADEHRALLGRGVPEPHAN